MIRGLQRLPKAEERALIEVACAQGMERKNLRCLMTRQRAQGVGVVRSGRFRGERYGISYDLMLCEYCGNLMPSEVCPAKIEKIKELLLSD